MSSNSSSKDEEQLLQDASTLLMFANVAAKQQLTHQKPALPQQNSDNLIQIQRNNDNFNSLSNTSQKHISNFSQNHKRSFSHPTFQNINSPGPASAALAEENSNHKQTGSMKAIIAAAALAEAADIPLPIPSRNQNFNQNQNQNVSSQNRNQNQSQNARPPLHSTKSLEDLNSIKDPASLNFEKSVKLKKIPKIEEIKENEIKNDSQTDDNNTEDELSKDEVPEKIHQDNNNIAKKSLSPLSVPVETKNEELDELEAEINKSLEQSDVPEDSSQIVISSNNEERESEHNDTVNTDGKGEFAAQENKEEEIKEEKISITKVELSTYQVDPDSGIIGCICGISDDDGFTIQCDQCYRWQHSQCMNINSIDEAPEYYLCYLCDPVMGNEIDKESVTQELLERLHPKRRRSGNHSSGKDSSSNSANSSSTFLKTDESSQPDKENSVAIGDKRSSEGEASNESKVFQQRKKKTKARDPDDENELLLNSETYQAVYYSLKQNDYKDLRVKNYLNEFGQKFYESNKNKNESQIDIMELSAFKTLELNQSPITKSQKKKNNSTVQVKPYVENPKQKFNGISKLGLFTSVNIPKDNSIIEFLGEVDFYNSYLHDPINQYRLWGTTKPKVLKAPLNVSDNKLDNLDLVIDSRFVGNESRFIRKSCPSNANCEMKPVYISQLNQFKFLIVASKNIAKDSELKLPWDWDMNHPILKMYPPEQLKFEQFNDEEKNLLISSIDNVSNFVECGCSTVSNTNDCALSKVRKASAHLLRSTRKTGPNKNKDEVRNINMNSEYTPWSERLIQRDQLIEMKLIVSNKTLTISPDNDISVNDEANTSEHSVDNSELENNSITAISNQIPYKYQLIKHFQKISNVKKLGVDKLSTHQNEIDTLDNVDEYLPIPIPIIPTAASLKPTSIRTVSSSSLINDVTTKPAAIGSKVKKLSFADYKKKLK